MGDIIKKSQHDQMKSWVQSIYQTTKGSIPNISDTTQGSIVLAEQAQTLQNLLTSAYESYVIDACSSHYKTDNTTDNDGQHGVYKTINCSTDNSTVKYSNFIGDVCSSDNSHDAGDKGSEK